MHQNKKILLNMWLFFAFISAALLGFYDVFKKQSLKNNDVIPVLFLNTLFCSLFFLPILITKVPAIDSNIHGYILLKAVIVLSSWALGYMGIKRLPLTIVGPINATRPVMVLIGALLFFGERLNLYQWIGVILAIVSFFLLCRSGKKEGIDFKHNRWIFCIVLAAILGAISGLYDKYLMAPVQAGGLGLHRLAVQSWYNVYQCIFMGIVWLISRKFRDKESVPFRWQYSILGISVFLSAADFAYFYALSMDGALIAVVSMIRRGSVIVSFLCGALIFREKNLFCKAVDLLLVLLGMCFLYWGSH